MSDSELSAFLLSGVMDVCECDGVRTEDVLAASGMTLADIQTPDGTVLRSKAVAVFNALAAASDRGDAAFRAGLYVPIELSAELVRLFRSAPDLPSLVAPLNLALGDVCGGLIGVTVGGGYARLRFGFPTWNVDREEPFQEAAAGVVVSALRTRFGPDWTPARVLIGHRRKTPEVVTFEGMEVVRGAPDNAVLLTAEEAYSGARPQNSLTPTQVEAQPELPHRRNTSFAEEVRRVASGRLTLMLGTEPEDVSKVFGISARTLRRRLSDEGTSLHSILEELKLAEAKRLLSETSLPITEIADVLRFAQPPSFTRAFRRMTGQSPSDFRESSRMLAG